MGITGLAGGKKENTLGQAGCVAVNIGLICRAEGPGAFIVSGRSCTDYSERGNDVRGPKMAIV